MLDEWRYRGLVQLAVGALCSKCYVKSVLLFLQTLLAGCTVYQGIRDLLSG